MTDYTKFLDSLSNYGIEPSLAGIRTLCRELGRPERRFDAIQVTGTNGKTSTARMTAAILSAHGLKTGLYTSPHLERYHERFVIDGREINAGRLARAAEIVRGASAAVERRLDGRRITQFEFLTAMAFVYFAGEKVDVAVVEVGVGGRWDATSVVRPKAAVITNVTLDHADYLGPTLVKIAGEKSYVIKRGARAVAGRMGPALRRIFQRRADRMGVDIQFLGSDIDARRQAGGLAVRGLYAEYAPLRLGVAGEFQIDNAALAVCAAEAYLGKPLDHKALATVLAHVSSPGRLEFVDRHPDVVLDGAHNAAGVRALAEALSGLSYGRLILVLSMLKDKQVDEMLSVLLPLADETVFATNANGRALTADALGKRAAALGFGGRIAASWKQALGAAFELAEPADMVLVTGSLYGVGEARQTLRRLLAASGRSAMISD